MLTAGPRTAGFLPPEWGCGGYAEFGLLHPDGVLAATGPGIDLLAQRFPQQGQVCGGTGPFRAGGRQVAATKTRAPWLIGIGILMSAFRLFAGILTQKAEGNALTLIPVHAELTTQQAADVLNVSRPYLIELLEKGAIPHRKVGTHRRVLFQDLMAYKNQTDQARLKALAELSAIDQELGLGY